MCNNCYIEFSFNDEENFEDLNHVFSVLKEVKLSEEPKPDKFWLENFPDYALKQFYFADDDIKPGFPTIAEDEFVWHFYSLIDLLQYNYEIDYINCYKITENNGRLEFYPHAYPYGGITGLLVFVSSFLCNPLIVDDGTGIYKVNMLGNGNFKLK